MIYKSNYDGQWHKVDPNHVLFDAEQTHIRRELFSSGIFHVEKNGDLYHLFIKDWSIGCWSPGDNERVRTLIRTAFNTYYALTKYTFRTEKG